MTKPVAAKARPPKRSTYQHGNLPAALKEAVLEMVLERGIRGVSVIEAARRSGVSSAAPYRHFANKESLLAAIAAIVYAEIVESMARARAVAGGDGAEQLSAVVRAYVDYAADNRAGIEVLFKAGLDHAEHEDLARLDGAAYQEYRACAEALGLPDELADQLVYAAAALAHGFTMLQLVASGAYAMSREAAAEQVGEAARRLAVGFKPGRSNGQPAAKPSSSGAVANPKGPRRRGARSDPS